MSQNPQNLQMYQKIQAHQKILHRVLLRDQNQDRQSLGPENQKKRKSKLKLWVTQQLKIPAKTWKIKNWNKDIILLKSGN